MIRKWLCAVLAVGIVILTLAGCENGGSQVDNDWGAASSQGEEITVDTAARSSSGQLIETENGYYCRVAGVLSYADKSDLTNWVMVCNDPTCEHALSSCPAKVFGGIAMANGRILTLRNTEDFELEGLSGFGVYSMAPDGTDLQLEYFIEESVGVNNGSHMSAFSDGQGTFYCGMSIMQTDGTYLNRVVKATADSSAVLAETVKNDMSIYVARHASSMRGDAALRTDLFATTEEDNRQLCRISGSELEDISQAEQYDLQGGYLSGDDLFHYIPGKGYYHTQISTGKSQKMMDAQLKDGTAYHFMGNFVVEHNLKAEYIPDEPQMLIYDGENWIDVEVPEDFEHTGASTAFPLALTTEHIFFEVYSAGANNLYFINYKDPNPVLTLCGQF